METLQWTGNPFVDAGLAVIVARAESLGMNVSQPEHLTPTILRQIVGDGLWLGLANRRLNAFSLVLGNNSPLMNSSTNLGLVLAGARKKITDAQQKLKEIEEKLNTTHKEKKRLQLSNQRTKAVEKIEELKSKLGMKLHSPRFQVEDGSGQHLRSEDDPGLKEYQIIIETLLEDILTGKYSKGVLCECTGTLPATDALLVASQHIRDSKLNVKRTDLTIGRDWFPLAGSLGNDAQALPAASRSPQISALALLAAQFLPLGTMILNGQLVIFQSTETTITQALVKEVYRETIPKIEAGLDKVQAVGTKAGSTPTAQILLKRFRDLREHQEIDNLPANTTLNLWLFSNSGTSASAEIIEFPHPALSFLWEASRNYLPELSRFLENEKKVMVENQLLTVIHRGREYLAFYPYKNQQSASIGLFELYQKKILERSSAMLSMAKFVAWKLQMMRQSADSPKVFKDLEKYMGDTEAMKAMLPPLKGCLCQWAEHGEFTLEDYALLFPCDLQPLRSRWDGWRLVWFYLNHPLSDVSKPDTAGVETMFTHPKIKQFASDLFSYYQSKIGLEKFQQRILEGFRRGEINDGRLRVWFINLAENGFVGYTNEDWDDLCRDENGNNVTYEVRFQLRLELANLYAQAVKDATKGEAKQSC